MKKPELLAPAGDFEKLQMAIAYGADAVYVGGKQFSLRANAKNFDIDGLKQAINYAHSKNAKVYVSVNIFAHNSDFDGLHEYLLTLKDMDVDAIIVADLGVLNIARQIKGLEIHISTQANVTNYQSAMLYKSLGASRAILARELSFGEIREINDKLTPTPSNFETEVFVHGAMCVSYSGRCLLSNYMVERDANKGDCAQSCRWGYELVEAKSGQSFPVYEDERGTYVLNSKDLCMIGHIPELVASGVSSLKIEGRMKTAYYVAAVTRAYRQALDDYFESESLYLSKKDYYLQELKKSSHRDFFTGFYMGRPTDGQNYIDTNYITTNDFLGVVMEYDASSQTALVQQRNKFCIGDEVEFIKGGFSQIITEIHDTKGIPVDTAPHPQQMLYVKVAQPVERLDIMRKQQLM